MPSSTLDRSVISPVKCDTRIRIRIRNFTFETWHSTLSRYPRTLLGCESKRNVYYNCITDEIIFHRAAEAFDAILFYYQSHGILSRPPCMNMKEFLDECKFFELDQQDIKRMKESENYIDLENMESTGAETGLGERSEPLLGSIGGHKISAQGNQISLHLYRMNLYECLEKPTSSKAAGVFATINFVLISASVIVSCLLTMPEVQKSRNPDLFMDTWGMAELVINVCFALEYLLKLAVCPCFIAFLISPMNLVNFLAIFPYFVVLVLNLGKNTNLWFLRLGRIIGALRLVRLSAKSKMIAAVFDTVRNSFGDMFTIFIAQFAMAILFGSVQYYVDQGIPETPFTTIPQSVWFAVQTIIPVGYGDIVPFSLGGKLVAVVVIIFGTITLSIPLLYLGGNYRSTLDKTSSPRGKDLKTEQ